MSGRFAVSCPTALKGGTSIHYGPAGEDWCRRAVTLGSEALDIAVTNGLDVAVLLVDSALHLRLVSRAGTEMLRAADGLALERDRLACADRAAHRRLRQLVAVAADPDRPVGSVAVPRPSGARPYLLTVMPLRDERAWLGTPRACALVLAIDAACCRPASAERLCERYRLTATEARTALALLDAERLQDVAERLGVSLPTVRTTLQRVFNKTDTHRQPELVWLLLAQGAAEDDAAGAESPCLTRSAPTARRRATLRAAAHRRRGEEHMRANCRLAASLSVAVSLLATCPGASALGAAARDAEGATGAGGVGPLAADLLAAACRLTDLPPPGRPPPVLLMPAVALAGAVCAGACRGAGAYLPGQGILLPAELDPVGDARGR